MKAVAPLAGTGLGLKLLALLLFNQAMILIYESILSHETQLSLLTLDPSLALLYLNQIQICLLKTTPYTT